MQYKRGVVVALVSLMMGGAFFFGYWWSQNVPLNGAAVLGAAVERDKGIEVFKVVQNGETDTSVILPRESVQMEASGENFVLVLDENSQVQKRSVQAQVWRKEYARVLAGLINQDLVVLNKQVAVGQTVEYRITNPEAGKSGAPLI